jgi:nitrogen PTS system EIIA component
MDFNSKDIISLLQISGETVYRWVRNKKIPCHRINHRYRLSRAEIKEDIFASTVNREEMMSAAIGRGIAIPHPRNPLITHIEDAGVTLCFLKNPLDFGALEGLPAHPLFILLTSGMRRHLAVRSKISYLCQLSEFFQFLQKWAAADILSFIRDRELAWQGISTCQTGHS